MIATQSLHRNNRSCRKQLCCLGDGVLACDRMHDSIFASTQERNVRTTNRTSIGLSMEAAVERIFVLALARRAQRKNAHGRLVPIVRHILNNGEAWTTIRAVNKRILVASVGRIKEFSQAL